LNLGGDPWSIFINSIESDNTKKVIKVNLEPGDMLVYSGCDLEHWRDKFKGNICAQVFLHYNHKNGKFKEDNFYDKRPLLGVPAFVKKYEITHVINCAEDSDSPTWWRKSHPDKYYHIEAQDSLHSNILKWYPEFKAILKLYLQDPSSMTIFVHCQCGINRSAFLSFMYVCDVFKFPLKYTEVSVIKQRPCMMTNTEFRKQVFDALNNGKS
jgi:hypothetical protein